jgi:hypothetical protein
MLIALMVSSSPKTAASSVLRYGMLPLDLNAQTGSRVTVHDAAATRYQSAGFGAFFDLRDGDPIPQLNFAQTLGQIVHSLRCGAGDFWFPAGAPIGSMSLSQMSIGVFDGRPYATVEKTGFHRIGEDIYPVFLELRFGGPAEAREKQPFANPHTFVKVNAAILAEIAALLGPIVVSSGGGQPLRHIADDERSAFDLEDMPESLPLAAMGPLLSSVEHRIV